MDTATYLGPHRAAGALAVFDVASRATDAGSSGQDDRVDGRRCWNPKSNTSTPCANGLLQPAPQTATYKTSRLLTTTRRADQRHA